MAICSISYLNCHHGLIYCSVKGVGLKLLHFEMDPRIDDNGWGDASGWDIPQSSVPSIPTPDVMEQPSVPQPPVNEQVSKQANCYYEQQQHYEAPQAPTESHNPAGFGDSEVPVSNDHGISRPGFSKPKSDAPRSGLPDVSRMTKQQRNAHFAARRKQKEIEELKKMGLNPEDFPSARSNVSKLKPLGAPTGGRRNDHQASSNSYQPRSSERSSYGQSVSGPTCDAGYGEEHVSGWGSSSSGHDAVSSKELGWGSADALPTAPMINARQDSPPGFAEDLSASGWSVDVPSAKAAAAPVSAPAPVLSAPKQPESRPAPAPSTQHVDSQSDLAASGRDIPAEPSIPALAASNPPPQSTSSTWSIDKEPTIGLPERRPLYSYNPEPTRNEPKSAPAPAPQQSRRQAPPSRPVAAPVNPLKAVVEETPMAAPAPVPVPPPAPIQRVPEPVAPRLQPPARAAPARETGAPVNPLQSVDSWGNFEDPIAAPPMAAAPVVQAPATPAVRAPVRPAAPVVQPKIAPIVPKATKPARPLREFKPVANPLESVDSWGDVDPMPVSSTNQSGRSTEYSQPAAASIPAPISKNTITCPNCRHCFELPK